MIMKNLPPKDLPNGKRVDSENSLKEIWNTLLFNKKVSIKTMAVFFLELSIMVQNGIPVEKSLLVIKEQLKPQQILYSIIETLLLSIRSGNTLSVAMCKYPDIFSPHAVAIIAAGEVSGSLTNAFNRLALSCEAKMRIENSIKQAVTYPLFILILSIGVVALLCFFALPPFVKLFHDLNTPVPPLTQAFLHIISFISRTDSIFFFFIASISLPVYIRTLIINNSDFRKKIESLLLSIPRVKFFLMRLFAERFCQTLGETLESGIPLIKCLQNAVAVTGSLVMKDKLEEIVLQVTQGVPLSTAALESKMFPRIVCQMISIGESTGNLPYLMQKASRYFEEEINHALSSIQHIIEPVILLFLGILMVAFMLIFFVPIYTAINAFGK